jgi:uncharacterized Fe-S cluster protein YjdI
MARIRRYEGEDIDILFDPKRCIHAEACIHGLAGVFEKDRRPWVDADAADADSIVDVVLKCPTGALTYERKDGGDNESAPDEATVRVSKNGPVYVTGSITCTDHEGNPVTLGPRVALCRCGASENKPFCDNSHLDVNFRPDGP